MAKTIRDVAGRTMNQMISTAFGDANGNVTSTMLRSPNLKRAILNIKGIDRAGNGATLLSKKGKVYYKGTDDELRAAARMAYKELKTETGKPLNGSVKMDFIRNIMSRGI